MTKIIVGMSGGVDSAVTALILKQQQGYEVEGATMAIYDGDANAPIGNACYGPEEIHDIEDAKRVCDFIGIPHKVVDLKKEYNQYILSYFKSEYESGRTPNPCVRCNQYMKFGLLLDRLTEMSDFDYFATGHYARKDYVDNRIVIRKSADLSKDQSYFLCMLSQKQLSKVRFPLGGLQKKSVRLIAELNKLPVAFKEESQDFTSLDYKKWMTAKEGTIVDESGKILGKHEGIFNYTLGQRKGLKIDGQLEPLYVVRIDEKKNTIIVGPEKNLYKSRMTVSGVNWIIYPTENSVEVKIRYRSAPVKSIISFMDNGNIDVRFDCLQRSPTPGQWAVFYDGDLLLGGGVIERE